MSAAASVDGQEKVMAAAQHIVNSLATSKNAADDMIRILSRFDNRLSNLSPSGETPSYYEDDRSEPVAEPSSAAEDHQLPEPQSEEELRLQAAERVIFHWNSSDLLLFENSHDESSEYLAAVDRLIALASGDPDEEDDRGLTANLQNRAETVLQMAMARLEDEFRHLMIRNTTPLDAAALSSPVTSHVSSFPHLDSLAGPSSSRTSLSFASDAHGVDDLDSSTDFDHSQGQDSLVDRSGQDSLVDRSGSGLAPVDIEEVEEGGVEEQPKQKSVAIDLVNQDAVIDLGAIADRMVMAGYGRELLQAYSSVRREVLDECLSIIGVERVSIEEVQRIEWRTLDDRMRRWSSAVEVVVRVLLSGERRLCEQIIASADPGLVGECFAEAARGCILQLLNFGDAIAVGRRAPEKLFRILGMYEALNDVMSDLQTMFPGEAGQLVLREAQGILHGLGDAARGTFDEFENAIRGESSKKPMQNCEIHPLTRYVMNYLKLIVCSKDSLNSLLDDGRSDLEDHSKGNNDVDSGQKIGNMTTLGRRLFHLISHLESNIEEKSKLYEDGGMQYIFLMNNLLYIIQKVRDSDLSGVLGDDWVRRRRGQIRKYATSYLRASWTKVLSYLKDDGLGGSGSSNSVSKVALKERFKNFNSAFEEIYRVQTAWKVPDSQLRDELQISISEKVIPAYRAFVGRFQNHLEGGRHAAKYIKYSPEDLENHLSDLFDGSPCQTNHARRKLGS